LFCLQFAQASLYRQMPVVRKAAAWSWHQVGSHAAVLYSIAAFAAVVHSRWQLAGQLWMIGTVVFWAIFTVTLILYFYVCRTDTTCHEAPLDLMSELHEPRICEECDTTIGSTRVKHCFTCNKCVADFDHHCRYLNVCITLGNYKAWSTFVLGLLILMVLCVVGSAGEMLDNDISWPSLVVCGLAFVSSGILVCFLTCLIAQHAYLVYEGFTTLEYVKNQAPGFPKLPVNGWRESVRRGECFNCEEGCTLAMIEVDPKDAKDEAWYCSVCQCDLAKAQVPFFNCDGCDWVCVCIPCRRVAEGSSYRPVVTSRVSTLRREPPWGPVRKESNLDNSFSMRLRTPSVQSHGSNLNPRIVGVQPVCGGQCLQANADDDSSSDDDEVSDIV